MPSLLQPEFEVFARLIRQMTGIALDSTKVYLVETRLASLLKDQHCASYSELLYKLQNDGTGLLKIAVIDRITTQETSFFRDQSPFEMLKFKILPDLIDARRRQLPAQAKIPLRIWSAACATGQEIYSIAIALRELIGDLAPFSIKILGTDISDAAVAKASRGVYSSYEIERGLPSAYLARYFSRDGDAFKVDDELRAMANFRRLNLFDDFSSLGRWDIIFCRNVAIYFSEEDKRSLFNRLHTALESDGAMIIGSTESILSVCPAFESKRYLRSVFYSKAGNAG